MLILGSVKEGMKRLRPKLIENILRGLSMTKKLEQRNEGRSRFCKMCVIANRYF